MSPTLIIGIAWVICGFLAYGMWKGGYRQFYKRLYEPTGLGGYDKGDELGCWICGIGAPAGLFAALVELSDSKNGFSFCLRIPEELKFRYRKRTD